MDIELYARVIWRHKVVVFTQFLGMIELMARHLEELGVGHVQLTGASVRRGETRSDRSRRWCTTRGARS